VAHSIEVAVWRQVHAAVLADAGHKACRDMCSRQ
jgi:hypothetical protein